MKKLVPVLLLSLSFTSTPAANENTGHMGILLSYSLNCKLMTPDGEARFDQRLEASGLTQETMFNDKDFRDLYTMTRKIGCDFTLNLIKDDPEFMIYWKNK